MADVLVVDDDPDGCEAVTRALRKSGQAVRIAPNGREALFALIDDPTPDVVVLDVRMPQMDGLQFLEVIRSYLRWSHLPVVLLTAYNDPPVIDRAQELGVNHVFLKANYKMPELLACIEELAAKPRVDA
ncbi:MAG: response regulator receiver protein [Phycisphaerales bacterium]|jgi:CheY-like chemotaxis protein|nr:response regulator receiver protein [Phycisphaerales bacterium]MDB5355077.1 response regulator receiver protein [Phycisphaerales bacterium]